MTRFQRRRARQPMAFTGPGSRRGRTLLLRRPEDDQTRATALGIWGIPVKLKALRSNMSWSPITSPQVVGGLGLNAVGADLYLDQQNIDTTTPTGRLLRQVTSLRGSVIRRRFLSLFGCQDKSWHEYG